MNRSAFIATAGVTLAAPTAALAAKKHKMNSRFDPVLKLRHDGLVVLAEGVTGTDEAAYYVAVIRQGERIGHGMSDGLYKGKRWDAYVVVDHGRFRPGSAHAYGVAVMPGEDESYYWSMRVELVDGD